MGGCQGKEVAACSPQEMANGRVPGSRALMVNVPKEPKATKLSMIAVRKKASPGTDRES
jgi:hypothetical protein